MSVHNPVTILQIDSTTGKPVEQISTAGAGHAALANPTTGTVLGIVNGGVSVADVYNPARDLFTTWIFGSDAAYSAALTVGSANVSIIWPDISLINPDARQLVIVNGNGVSGCDYSYTVYMSRNGLGVTTDDMYATSLTAGAGSKANILSIPIPASVGFDHYVGLSITPTAGQASAQLTFKAYLIGRGG